jgi:lipoprotein-releasing system ATP-binding protein
VFQLGDDFRPCRCANGAAWHHMVVASGTKLRGHSIGFVFQSHYLISGFTAIENVMTPMLVD